MENKETKKFPTLLKSEVIETWEDPSDKLVYFEAPESGSDTRQHRWQARYKYTKIRKFFDDGSTEEHIKNELIPGTLLDLGAIKEDQKAQEDEAKKDETTPAPKDNVIPFPEAS